MTLFGCLIFVPAVGQSTIYYHHDASGNRDLRSITLPASSAQSVTDFQEELQTKSTEQEEFKDKLDEKEVLIYPNPVKSELTVKIPALDNDAFVSLSVYNQEGRLVYDDKRATSNSIIDFSEFPPGIYLLNISLLEKSIQWKIVKE